MHKRCDHVENPIRQLHELYSGTILDELLLHIDNAAMRHASFDDDRAIAECESELVKGIDVKGKGRFDLNITQPRVSLYLKPSSLTTRIGCGGNILFNQRLYNVPCF